MQSIDFVNKQGKKIIPDRIKDGRIANGFSLNDLAVEIGLSKQVISKYEKGMVNIPSENLLKIAEVLNFPITFFFKNKYEELNIDNENVTFFRSLRSTSKKVRMSLQQNVIFMAEIYKLLSEYINFPTIDIPKEINEGYKINISNEYIENVALKLREYWKLGNKPIMNLVNLLFKKGFIISKVELKTHSVDAFSRWCGGNPYIILGSDKESPVRSRFDLAHELGHLILHSKISDKEFSNNSKILEKEANRFASALLLPREEFVKDIYNASLNNFMCLKEKWKVSIAAMIYRAHDLEIISDFQYTTLMKQMTIKKWKKKEPLDENIKFEKPNMIKEAIELLEEHNILTTDELLEKTCLNEERVEKLCFLPKGYFKNKSEIQYKPVLKIIK